MKQIANAFLDHFDFSFDGSSPILSLAASAPDGLRQLAERLCATRPPETLICLYEGLAAVAETEAAMPTTFDEAVCPASFMRELVDELSRMVLRAA